jgi:hypothetical protein
MNAIGGYFGLELRDGEEYHTHALRLNTGRNALEYIIRAREYKKIYLPQYTCHVLLQPVKNTGITYEYYRIDEQLEPVFDFASIEENEAFLYTNYFGIKDGFLPSLRKQTDKLIIDNAQAFYSRPLPDMDTFYSARKFFGVPDGAYLYTKKEMNGTLERDESYRRFAHLLIRADVSAETGYPQFLENDAALDNNPIREMSAITRKLLKSIDYNRHIEIRNRNFAYLHSALKNHNLLSLPETGINGPMIYPFLSNASHLRTRLIKARIYVAQYWPEVLSSAEAGSIESQLAENLIPLPIDQRVTTEDLDYIIKTIDEK